MEGSRKARLLPSVLFGLVSAAVLVTIVTQPRMHTIASNEDPLFQELDGIQVASPGPPLEKKMNIHINFVTPPPSAPAQPPSKKLNIHLHLVSPEPPPPPPAPKTHISVHVIKEPAPAVPPPPPPAKAVKVTRIVKHKSHTQKNGTITHEKVVTIVTDKTHTAPASVPAPEPTEPAVKGHNIIVNVIKHGSVSPTQVPLNGPTTGAPSSPKGAIVVNVIDHKHKKIENDNEVEPAGDLLPPDWAQHMGQNLPPAEPIGSETGNPKVDIYAINFTDKTYYFEYCGKRYNEIPPRSVIGQETYGNEVWEIVADDGVVMIQAKVVEYNQRFIIKDALTQITTADYH